MPLLDVASVVCWAKAKGVWPNATTPVVAAIFAKKSRLAAESGDGFVYFVMFNFQKGRAVVVL
jgi:hypothetical protein